MAQTQTNALFRGAPDSDILPFDAGELFDTYRIAGEQRFGIVSTAFILNCLFISDLLCKTESGKSFTSSMWTYVKPDLKISYVRSGASLDYLTSWHLDVLKRTFNWVAPMKSHQYIFEALDYLCSKKTYGDIVGGLSPEECLKLLNDIESRRKHGPQGISASDKDGNDEFLLVPPPERSPNSLAKKIYDDFCYAPEKFSPSDGFSYSCWGDR